MAQIGRKIYYERTNGVVIWDKGEMAGDVAETTLKEDMVTMPVMALIDLSQLCVKQLEYGALKDSFATCKGYRVNPDTKEIEFVF